MKIGKDLGKTIKVSVVGSENADGGYEPYKKAVCRLYLLNSIDNAESLKIISIVPAVLL
jgi:hypothetical protein